MKRIIFSQYSSTVEDHTSVTDYKRSQFNLYKDRLIEKQKQYARSCNVDYECFELTDTNYVDIQFLKLLRFEELSEKYDEVLYLDLDVIPITDLSFFDKLNLNNICGYNIQCELNSNQVYWRNKDDSWHAMDMYSKTCAKNAMLLLNDLKGNDYCLNTGVLGMNKSIIERVGLSNKLNACKELFYEAKEDNIYPNQMSKSWEVNNEVILSYIAEKEDIPIHNIGLAWNFILDHTIFKFSSAAHMIHVVNKRFEDYKCI